MGRYLPEIRCARYWKDAGFGVLNDDGSATGYILGSTEDVLTLKMMGGTQNGIPWADIKNFGARDKSLAAEGLAKVMFEDDLADLVEYSGTLRVDEEVLALN